MYYFTSKRKNCYGTIRLKDSVDKRFVRRDNVARSYRVSLGDVKNTRKVSVVDVNNKGFVGILRDDNDRRWRHYSFCVCPIRKVFYRIVLPR